MAKASRYWTCSACGQVVVNEPFPVFRHQLSHIGRRPLATNKARRERDQPEPRDNAHPSNDGR